MADIHVLTGDRQNRWNLVFHFAVPDLTNAVSIGYRTALISSAMGGSTSLPDGDGTDGTISSVEKASIEAGVLYEHHTRFRVEGNGDSPGAVQTELRALYTRTAVWVLQDLQTKLKYFGHTESEGV